MPQFLNSPAIWLIDHQLVQANDKAVSVSKSRIKGGFPNKGPVMWRSRLRASPNIICMGQWTHCLCSKSYEWHMKARCTLRRPDDLATGNISPGWLIVNVLCHQDDIRSLPKSSGWHNVRWTLCHPDEIAPGRTSSGWLMTNAGCHPDDLRCCPMSSGQATGLDAWASRVKCPARFVSHLHDICIYMSCS